MASPRAFRLIIEDKNVKRCYLVDDFKSLTFQYSKEYNEYLISFIQYHKRVLVGCQKFTLLGTVYFNG